MLIYVWITLLILGLTLFWVSNLFGVPGNWLMVVTILVWTICVGPGSASDISWITIVISGICAGIGELLEFGASVWGAKKAGGGKRAATLSIVGSIIGGIAGAILGIPIPIPLVGMLVGGVLFACIGAMVGATIGQKWEGSDLEKSIKVGGAAFVGRFVGTVAKFAMGALILVISIGSLFI